MIYYFADTHFHDWKAMSQATADGTSSRLMEQVAVVSGIANKVTKDDHVIFLGDWLHAQGKTVHREVFYLAYSLFETIANKARLVIIPGNHDLYGGRIGIYRPLKKIAKIIDKPEVYELGGVYHYLLPFTDDRRVFQGMMSHLGNKDGGKILCSHIGVMGAKAGLLEYMVKEPVLPNDILDHVDLAVLGHYHGRQTVANFIHYVGSPYQMDFGDMGSEHGYTVWTGNGLESHKLDGPQFWNVVINEPEELDKFKENFNDKHYYKVIVRTKKISPVTLDEIIGLGYRVSVEREIKRKTVPRVQVKPDDIGSLVDSYLGNVKTDLDKSRIKTEALSVWENKTKN